MESLYRKYRPQTFADVVGQHHIVSTLERAVTENRVSHAYLFCGPRGTGKTTMARILAKALLCEHGPNQLPDGTCEECRLIAAGEHPDVYELDAASRTGVDNVRTEIIENVNYAPLRGRYKVYVIDEVHMLTPQAFNALLKTLEEPPEHVIFIMCTTDPQKILATILSRVQRFDFHSISDDEIRAHLADICNREGFTFEDAALDLIVRRAHGGMRDALSVLEQVSVSGGGAITEELTRELLGEVSDSGLKDVSVALAKRDVATLFNKVADIIDEGRDPLQFTRELALHIRNLYVLSITGAKPGVLSVSEEELSQLNDEAALYEGPDRLSHILVVLGQAAAQMRGAVNQRLALEIALTRLSRPESDLSLEALADRVETLEKRMQEAPAAPVAAASKPEPAAVAAPAFVPPVAPAPAPAPSAVPAPAPAPEPVVAPAPIPEPVVAAAPVPGPAAEPAPTPEPEPYIPAASQAPIAEVESAPTVPAAPTSQQIAAPAAPSAPQPAADSELQRAWKAVVDNLLATCGPYGAIILDSYAKSDDGTNLVISLPPGATFARRMIDRQDVKLAIDNAVKTYFGGPRELIIEPDESVSGTATAAPTSTATLLVPEVHPLPETQQVPMPAEPAAPEPVVPEPAPQEPVAQTASVAEAETVTVPSEPEAVPEAEPAQPESEPAPELAKSVPAFETVESAAALEPVPMQSESEPEPMRVVPEPEPMQPATAPEPQPSSATPEPAPIPSPKQESASKTEAFSLPSFVDEETVKPASTPEEALALIADIFGANTKMTTLSPEEDEALQADEGTDEELLSEVDDSQAGSDPDAPQDDFDSSESFDDVYMSSYDGYSDIPDDYIPEDDDD